MGFLLEMSIKLKLEDEPNNYINYTQLEVNRLLARGEISKAYKLYCTDPEAPTITCQQFRRDYVPNDDELSGGLF